MKTDALNTLLNISKQDELVEVAREELKWLIDNCRWPHDHEKWLEEAIGCCVCSKATRGLTGEDLEDAAKSVDWETVELRAENKALKERVSELERAHKFAYNPTYVASEWKKSRKEHVLAVQRKAEARMRKRCLEIVEGHLDLHRGNDGCTAEILAVVAGRIRALPLEHGDRTDCLGCMGGSIHHTCGREPDADLAGGR